MAYDSVCKFIAETFTTDITTWLLGEPVELARLEPSELLVKPIYADSLVLLESQSLVLHIEFQVVPKPELPFRMTDYAVRAFRRFPKKALHQVVVYLRQESSPLVHQTVYARGRLRHEFDGLRVWEQPMEVFQQSPGLLPFAVLGRSPDPVRTLEQVAAQIEEMGDRDRQQDIAASTAILAGLVLDKALVRSVLREDVMKESVVYQDIVETSKRQGRLEGKLEGELGIVLRQLQRRFGGLTSSV